MAKVLFKRIEDSSLIDNYDVVDGSFIVTKDGKVFVDYESERIPIIVKEDAPGTVKMFAGSTAPDGYLICDGSEVSRTTYSALFEAIGTSWGSGDGTNTFNIPDMRKRNVVGYDSTETDFNEIGKTGGNPTVRLTMDNLPYHKLNLLVAGGSDAPAGLSYSNNGGSWNSNFSEVIGGSQKTFSIVQPYGVMNFIIKY